MAVVNKMLGGIKDYANVIKFRECERRYDKDFENYFEDVAKLKDELFPADFYKATNLVNGQLVPNPNNDEEETSNLGFGD